MSDWLTKYLGDVTNNLDSRRKPLNERERSTLSTHNLYPYYGANGELDCIDDYIFDEKIICIAEDGGTWGKGAKSSYIVDEKCWVNNHAHVLTAKNELSLEYLRYFLNYSDLSKYITGSTRGKLTKSALDRIEIPLPPLAEQRRIAAILDKAEAIREKRLRVIAKLDELVQSVFIDMFGDPVTNPKGWEVKELKDLTNLITDGVHAKPNYTSDGVPFISVKDITTGRLYFDNCKYISLEDHLKFTKRCKPEQFDILYTKVGATYGRAVIVDTQTEFSIYVSVALIKPNRSSIDSLFLKAVLNSSALKKQADKSIKGIGVPDLHLIEIKKFLVPVPPMNVQLNFVRKINTIQQHIYNQQKQLMLIGNLFLSLQHCAFTGELTNDSNESQMVTSM